MFISSVELILKLSHCLHNLGVQSSDNISYITKHGVKTDGR